MKNILKKLLKKLNQKILITFLLITANFISISVYFSPEASADVLKSKINSWAVQHECDPDVFGDEDTPGAKIKPSATTLKYGGKIWDVIGINTDSYEEGISGPSESVTLLLDKKSAKKTDKVEFSKYNTPEYSKSILIKKFASYYNKLANHEGIIPRTLEGESGFSTDLYFDSDKVFGKDVKNQYLWPLSIFEVNQLKASVSAYNGSFYWTRTAGSSKKFQGGVYIAGWQQIGPFESDINNKEEKQLIRPAMYLSLSVLSDSQKDKIENNKFTIGTCQNLPTIKTGKYIWDIAGYNNKDFSGLAKGEYGANTETENTVTLVLSNQSKNRFEFKQRNNKSLYKDSVEGIFNSINNSSDYSKSDLAFAMNQAYQSSKLELVDSRIQPIPRIIRGGKLNDLDKCLEESKDCWYTSNNTYGEDLPSQNFWALSAMEVKALNGRMRLFLDSYWLRSPATDYDTVGIMDSGSVEVDDYNSVNALRPAFQTKLTPELAKLINDAGGEKIYNGRSVEPQKIINQPNTIIKFSKGSNKVNGKVNSQVDSSQVIAETGVDITNLLFLFILLSLICGIFVYLKNLNLTRAPCKRENIIKV
ncbi:MAG: hypothetical protein LBM13_02610 [Candidatus Ancillula sp.]|jgi:hypothetical protein|nr:hypothetical protein [Candidatus Ancillula sp.]